MTVEVERAFIGAGCNRIVHNFSWGACDLISFGAQKISCHILPQDCANFGYASGPQSVCELHALVAQIWKGIICYLEFSGGSILLWEFSVANKKWRNVLQVPEKHKKGVTCIAAIVLSQTDALFTSSSSDGVVSIWEIIFPSSAGGECKLSCLDSIVTGKNVMVAPSLVELPGNCGHLALAMGGLDNKIRIYCGQRSGKTGGNYWYMDEHVDCRRVESLCSGFYGGRWSPSGSSILVHGYGGSFHHWKNVGSNFDNWKPQKVPPGHFAPVSDISWARDGEYLLYLLAMIKVFSAWSNESIIEDGDAWHEIA
ncbi:elongator complex protein 2-like [Salvia divinorum]|uniref:Elongator complex protein 2 n=1 Tax=Salvia divinorum TaxID=28513 RepID=A0ABD1HJL4_SALDI